MILSHYGHERLLEGFRFCHKLQVFFCQKEFLYVLKFVRSTLSQGGSSSEVRDVHTIDNCTYSLSKNTMGDEYFALVAKLLRHCFCFSVQSDGKWSICLIWNPHHSDY